MGDMTAKRSYSHQLAPLWTDEAPTTCMIVKHARRSHAWRPVLQTSGNSTIST